MLPLIHKERMAQTPARRVRDAEVHVHLAWHYEWSSGVEEAFEALPFDPLMDVEVVRAVWEQGVGRARQRIAVLRDENGQTVGIVPLRKRSRYNWHLLMQYVMPYARFFVRPGYTETALAALGRFVGCGNILFYETPADAAMLRPEESWVVTLPPTYEELMRQTGYASKDRRCRRRAEGLELREDRFEDLPLALDLWQQKWTAAGSLHTAGRKDELLTTYRALASQGRLKIFSMYDGAQLVGMDVAMIAPPTLYGLLTISRDEYRAAFPGIRLLLACLEWACIQGLSEVDMLRTSGHYKSAWAQRGWRLIRSPLGSQHLGLTLEGVRRLIRRRKHA